MDTSNRRRAVAAFFFLAFFAVFSTRTPLNRLKPTVQIFP
jgi:hypothetical protein